MAGRSVRRGAGAGACGLGGAHRRLPGIGATIHEAIAAGRLLVVSAIPPDPELPDLDEGEAACLRLAQASPGPSLVLIDERAGRAVAQELGLQVAGTAAVIDMARRRGLIASARQVFRDLHGSDFRIAPAVIQAVLEHCGETNPRPEACPSGATPDSRTARG